MLAPALLVLLVLCPRAPAGESLPELLERVRPAVVTVVAFKPEKAMPGVSTGFFISGSRVITVRHALAGADRAEVRTSSGRTLRVAGVLADDPPRDLVLIQAEGEAGEIGTLPLATSTPRAGERIHLISSPLGLEGSASTGIVSAVWPIPGGGSIYQHTAPVSTGSSGAPLFNLQGEVLGLQVATITSGDPAISAGQCLNFAVPAEGLALLRPGKIKSLSRYRREIREGWISPITRAVDTLGLRPLTREDFRGALKFFEECTRRTPGEADAWFRLGLCHEKLENDSSAEECYRKAISLNADFATAWNNLGVLHFRGGRFKKAAEALERAVKIEPEHVKALASLADTCNRLGRYREALDAARRAVRIDPRSAGARYHLGVALLKTGSREEARKEYESLLPLDGEMAKRLKKLIDGS